MTTPIKDPRVHVIKPTCPPVPSLQELMNKLAELRGTPDEWLDQEVALSRHIATCHESFRVLCRGEYRSETSHHPAALVYNTQVKGCEVWIAKGPDNLIEMVDVHNFHSTIPHVGIAREVFMENDSGNSTI